MAELHVPQGTVMWGEGGGECCSMLLEINLVNCPGQHRFKPAEVWSPFNPPKHSVAFLHLLAEMYSSIPQAPAQPLDKGVFISASCNNGDWVPFETYAGEMVIVRPYFILQPSLTVPKVVNVSQRGKQR